MAADALVIAYHAVEPGPPPLFVDPSLFAEHLDALADAGARLLTFAELARALREDTVPERAVALTFDDAFESVVTHAAPMLIERQMTATLFCVAGHLGRDNDWPTQPPSTPRRRLASPGQLRELAAAGLEIGAHGMSHAPLAGASRRTLQRELLDAHQHLEHAVQVRVRTVAYPYGVAPAPSALPVLRLRYEAGCILGLERARVGVDPFAVPRVDAHYLRRPARLRRVAQGDDRGYLAARRIAARARRLVVKDYGGADETG